MTDLNQIRKVHFIGIGGIGVSAIARMMLLLGKEVSGSDQSRSEVTDELGKNGAKIFYEHNASNISEDVDLVVYTIAIPNSNPELAKALELKIKTLTYPEILGEVSKAKKTIAVAGTHGKTTTTGMLAEVLLKGEKDPTVVIGSLLKRPNGELSNFIAGLGEYFVAEACEYKRSFLSLHPHIAVITNIEEDHLDYYKDIEDIKNAFREFVDKVPADGFVVCNLKSEIVSSVVKNISATVVDCSDEKVPKLAVIGKHNIENAKVAKAVGKIVGIEEGVIDEALSLFAGTWRRLEFKGKDEKGALWYDDYAHHPTEIRSSLNALKEEYPDKKIIVAFQPHLYSRTKNFFSDFVESLLLADHVLLADIYAAREKDDGSINSADLAKAVTEKGGVAEYAPDLLSDSNKLKALSDENTVLVTMGAGDIHQISNIDK